MLYEIGPGAVMNKILERRKPPIEFFVGSKEMVVMESVSVHHLSGHVTQKFGPLFLSREERA